MQAVQVVRRQRSNKQTRSRQFTFSFNLNAAHARVPKKFALCIAFSSQFFGSFDDLQIIKTLLFLSLPFAKKKNPKINRLSYELSILVIIKNPLAF